MCQSQDIGQNPDGGTSDFRISGQSLTNENGNKSNTNNGIDMKLESVSKLDTQNAATSKKIDDGTI